CIRGPQPFRKRNFAMIIKGTLRALFSPAMVRLTTSTVSSEIRGKVAWKQAHCSQHHKLAGNARIGAKTEAPVQPSERTARPERLGAGSCAEPHCPPRVAQEGMQVP